MVRSVTCHYPSESVTYTEGVDSVVSIQQYTSLSYICVIRIIYSDKSKRVLYNTPFDYFENKSI